MADDIWITTDAAGFVIDCSSAAVPLIGYTARGARRRELPNMFVGDRPRLPELLRAAQGDVIEREASFRPNDRKAMRVRFTVSRGDNSADGQVTLLWRFQVRWPIGMRIPTGVDRRQLITVWRASSMRCVFVPAGADKRRLLVCGENDIVLHEEGVAASASAFTRAFELRRLLAEARGTGADGDAQ